MIQISHHTAARKAKAMARSGVSVKAASVPVTAQRMARMSAHVRFTVMAGM